MNANKDPTQQVEHDLATPKEDSQTQPSCPYDCAACRFIYDERTGLCSVCIRKILDTHVAQKQKHTAQV